MANQEKEPLFVSIVDAAPELDFLFALARRTKVSITFSVDGEKQDMGVYIDSLSVGEGERIHPTSREFSNTWLIEGHFYGNEFSSSEISHRPARGKRNYEVINVWGSFRGTYNKGKRKGQIQTVNYNRSLLQHSEFCLCSSHCRK